MSSGQHSTPLDPARYHGGKMIYAGTHGRCRSKSDKLDFTSNLFRIWRDFPDMRLGQLIENAVDLYRQREGMTPKVFYMEDDVMHESLYRFWLEHSEPGKRILARRAAADEKRSAGS